MSEIIQIIAEVINFISEIMKFISQLMILILAQEKAMSKTPVRSDEQRAHGCGKLCTFKTYMGDNENYLGEN